MTAVSSAGQARDGGSALQRAAATRAVEPRASAPIPSPTIEAAATWLPADAGERFRPDVEGMRAVAIVLVLLYHGYTRPLTGGFVGVDVFFVISGFLITNLLLHEQSRTGRISTLRFYARRVRRILPASTLVVLVTLFATYYWLGFIAGNDVANDAKWTTVFAADIHFGLIGTDYFGSQLPPSPLGHMWSLGVEEQFYLVWPGLFLLLVLTVRGARHRNALAASLLIIIGASLVWSVVQTSSNATWAYFSPLTRAWELALGALVAVVGPFIIRVRSAWVLEVLAVCGLAGISVSALVLTDSTPYPGWAVALPVVSSALLIAAGSANPRTIVGRMLSVRPMQWVGARSYSLYLWHWPLLIIAAQYARDDLSVLQTTGCILLAVVASAITYRLVENPVRRARFLTSRTGLSLAVGAVLIVGTIAVAQWQIASHYGTWNPADSARGANQTYATTAQVLESVKAAENYQRLPDAVAAGLTNENTIHVSPCYDRQRVENPADANFFGECTYGDPQGKKVMVAYGDSHSDMWAAPLMRAAAKAGWQLRVFAKHACPAPDMPFRNPDTKTHDEKCDVFHSTAPAAVQALHPDLVIATSISDWLLADTSSPTPTQWRDGWVATLNKLAQPGTRLAMLGDIPVWSGDGPRCLAAHVSAVQDCSVRATEAAPKRLEAEQAAAAAVGALYIPTMPWICADRCEPVIADNRVYNDDTHLTEAYLKYLTGAVNEALQPLLT